MAPTMSPSRRRGLRRALIGHALTPFLLTYRIQGYQRPCLMQARGTSYIQTFGYLMIRPWHRLKLRGSGRRMSGARDLGAIAGMKQQMTVRVGAFAGMAG